MEVETAAPSRVYRWYHKLTGLLFAIFCFEMGVFLVVFPWLDSWNTNYFAWIEASTADQAWIAETWRSVWRSPHFRGAVSGLGFVNIYFSILEVYRLRRYSPDSG
ncbi:MAG: hypothetical protein FJW20_05800 [Acidimicrobiia bacterium]|nr:hypothetical protein [Acidimicrobiia bacterium]